MHKHLGRSNHHKLASQPRASNRFQVAPLHDCPASDAASVGEVVLSLFDHEI